MTKSFAVKVVAPNVRFPRAVESIKIRVLLGVNNVAGFSFTGTSTTSVTSSKEVFESRFGESLVI